MKKVIVVTGGCGYIGSHTIIELIKNNYSVISIDNLSRSTEISLDLVFKITGVRVKNYKIDLCDYIKISEIFSSLNNVYGVIHFAAFKSVPESISTPGIYYHNNINSLLNILLICRDNFIKKFVFSSSCSVYGDINELPVSEVTKLSKPKSPYASTKIFGEKITEDFCNTYKINAICLRYFNPVGAHITGQLGEIPYSKPDNLIPVITQTGIGKRKTMEVYGGLLNTRDGSCIRDYVHVMDIADAHVLSLNKLEFVNNYYDVINLGTGIGVSVFEAINTFQKVSGLTLNYTIAKPRNGDVIEIYSNVEKAQKILGWKAKFDINDMMLSAWKWELQLQQNNNIIN